MSEAFIRVPPGRFSVEAVEKFGYGDGDRDQPRFEQIIGQSAALEAMFEQVECVAPTDSTVLIQGERGTGMEWIERAIHNISSGCGRSFVQLHRDDIPP